MHNTLTAEPEPTEAPEPEPTEGPGPKLVLSANPEPPWLARAAALVRRIANDLQKPAALVMGILSAAGVTPAPAGKLATTSVLVGYAAFVHAIEALSGAGTA